MKKTPLKHIAPNYKDMNSREKIKVNKCKN